MSQTVSRAWSICLILVLLVGVMMCVFATMAFIQVPPAIEAAMAEKPLDDYPFAVVLFKIFLPKTGNVVVATMATKIQYTILGTGALGLLLTFLASWGIVTNRRRGKNSTYL